MINFDFNKNCYGCKACVNICPNNAILMKKNIEGFEVPVIDKDKCVNCGLCKEKCIYLKENINNFISDKDIIRLGYRKNHDKYKEYTSSGIFSALAKIFVDDDNYVVGCIWDENMVAKHILTNDEILVKKMACSKYVQSDMNSVFRDIQEKINNKKKVLFSGTPCQVASIKNYFKNNDNLYTIAIVCHGSPSPEVWKTYKEKLEKIYDSKMVNANFRYKGKYGWITPFTRYEFENGKSVEKLSFTDDEYVIAFGADILHRNTCYTCKYKGTNSNADLIIGDFWGCPNRILRKSKNKGVSSVIIHSEKGKKMLELLKNEFMFEDIKIDDIVKENPPVLNPVKYNIKRDDFFDSFIKDKNIDYLTIGMENIRYKIKKILYRLSIFEWLKRLKYILKHK